MQVPPDVFWTRANGSAAWWHGPGNATPGIRRRLDAGKSLSGISRATGLDRKIVQRFARVDSAGELLGRPPEGIEAG